MEDIFPAIAAIHRGFTMTSCEWQPEWTLSISLSNFHNS